MRLNSKFYKILMSENFDPQKIKDAYLEAVKILDEKRAKRENLKTLAIKKDFKLLGTSKRNYVKKQMPTQNVSTEYRRCLQDVQVKARIVQVKARI